MARKSVVDTWSISDTADGWALHVEPRMSLRAMLPATGLRWLGLLVSILFSLGLLANEIEEPLKDFPPAMAAPFILIGIVMWWVYLRPSVLRDHSDANDAFDLHIKDGRFMHEGGVFDEHVLSTLRLISASRSGRSRLAFDGDVISDVQMLPASGVATAIAEQVRDAVLGRVQRGC